MYLMGAMLCTFGSNGRGTEERSRERNCGVYDAGFGVKWWMMPCLFYQTREYVNYFSICYANHEWCEIEVV